MSRQKAISFLKTVTLIGVYGGLLMPLVFLPIVIFPFVFSKLIFFQILIGLTFPAYLILAWIEPAFRPKFHILYTAIAAYFFALFLSVVFAVDPMRAWWGNQERMNGLFTLLHFFVWLTMAIGVLRTWKQWHKLLNYEVVLSALMAIVALLQKIYPRLLLFPASDRVGGLLDNPIYMGAYQIFNLFFLALLFLKTRSKTARVWYSVIALIDLAAFFAAQSRGDLVGLAAGLFVFALFFGFFNKNKSARLGAIGLVIAAFAAYGLLFAFRNTAVVQNSSFARLTNFSLTVNTRFIAWKIAWQGFLERPLTGWGLDNFHILFNLKYNPQSLRFGTYETWFDRSHNTILDVLSMTGIFGFLTFASIFITLFYSVWRAFRRGWIDLEIAAILFALPIAYFVQNLFVFDHPAAFSMSFLLYAFVIAATRGEFVGQREVADSSDKVDGKRPFSWAMFGIMQALFLLLVWRTSVLPFQASRLAIKSNNTFSGPQGFEYAKAASDIWTPYLDEQTFLLSRNLIVLISQGTLQKLPNWQELYRLTTRLTEEELQRHPRNTHPHFIYAQLATGMAAYLPQEAAVAEREYQKAIETSPKRQQLYFGLANLYLRQGRIAEALSLYQKVRDFDLDLGEGHWMYGLALFYDKHDVEEGAKELRLSQTSAYPYAPVDGRELIPLADAYLTLKDTDAFRGLVDRLPNVAGTQGVFYAQLAYKYQLAKMLDLRDRVLAYGSSIDPSTKTEYNKLVPGSFSSGVTATSSSTGAGPRR